MNIFLSMSQEISAYWVFALVHLHRTWRDVLVHAGNYDTYLQVRSELEDAQAKKHKWEQDQISHMKVNSPPPAEGSRTWTDTSLFLQAAC